MNTAPLLPGLIIPGEPVEVQGVQLAAVIAQAKHAGLYVRRMDASGSSYTLHLSRDPKPDCACDLCQALTAPSDQIEATLRHTAEQEGTAVVPPVPASASQEGRTSQAPAGKPTISGSKLP